MMPMEPRSHRSQYEQIMHPKYRPPPTKPVNLKCTYSNCCVKHPKDCPTDGKHGDKTEDYSCLLFPPQFEEE